MTSLLESKLAATVGKALGPVFLPATLTRLKPASGGDAFNPGTPTEVEYSCKAIHEGWSAFLIANSMVGAHERKVLILASTLSVEPMPGDKITIREHTFTIAPAGSSGQPVVTTDPAKAVWTCRASA